MVVLVLSMHAVDTYSPFGAWYHKEHPIVGRGTALVFATYQSALQAFFMALLFFVAGYFAAPSYDRKGARRFLRDRFVRLGVPTLLYMFLIGPLTQYFLSRTWGRGGFAHQWIVHLVDGEWLSESGPMWFCFALLLFNAAYVGMRLTLARPIAPTQIPSRAAILAFVLAIAAATFLARIPFPEDVTVLNMHPGDFPQYVLMFAAGLAAARGAWLRRFDERSWMRLGALLLLCALGLFALLLRYGGALEGDLSRYSGGINAVSAAKSLWEALVCIGASVVLLAIYRRRFDRQGPLARSFSDAAFGVYWIHPPILIVVALLMEGVALPSIAKAALLNASPPQ